MLYFLFCSHQTVLYAAKLLEKLSRQFSYFDKPKGALSVSRIMHHT
jgi:hypothetical protein